MVKYLDKCDSLFFFPLKLFNICMTCMKKVHHSLREWHSSHVKVIHMTAITAEGKRICMA